MKVILTPEVAAALAGHQPVVALESTIIAHGMAYPANVETALAVEQVVRDHGAVPATIAVYPPDSAAAGPPWRRRCLSRVLRG